MPPTASWLRQQGNLRDVVLIAVTGCGRDEARRRPAEVGFAHFFLKPVDIGELDQLMRSVRRQAAAQPGG